MQGNQSRDAAFVYLSDTDTTLDVLVVGGGITGAGIALDATTRGLNTAIFEAGDWGEGTSSRSSKLIHGGIRYLEQLKISLVREALAERNLLLNTLAPHLVRPVQFIYPIQRRVWERLYMGAGMLMYDVFARTQATTNNLPWHRHLSAKRLRAVVPGLRANAFHGGLVYYDAQVDDARLVTTVVRTAVQYGAIALNRMRVLRYLREGTRVVGVTVTDTLTGGTRDVRAKHVIGATGVWTNDTDNLLGEPSALRVTASQGVHLVVPREKFASELGLLSRTPNSVLFVIPWGEYWLIGTTDTAWKGDVANPQATEQDIEYLLEQVNKIVAAPLQKSDIVGVYAGLRPLVSRTGTATSRVSREHSISHPAPGLTLIAGGKLTTYRVMAADAVDAALTAAGDNLNRLRSVTAEIPLLGATGVRGFRNRAPKIGRDSGLTTSQVHRLLDRYGSSAAEVWSLAAQDAQLATPVMGAAPLLAAEVVHAVTHEGALSIADVLERRSRVSIETADHGYAAAPAVAALIAPYLGWGETRQRTEIASYRETIALQRTHSAS